MNEAGTGVRSAEPWLDPITTRRLHTRLEVALRRARTAGTTVLASATGRSLRAGDPTAVIAATRGPGEPWFVLEQPARERWALAALGCVRALEARGPDRFEQVDSSWRGLAAAALADPAEGPSGSGLVAVGGFAFAHDGGESPSWSGFAPGSLIVPELSLARRGRECWLTVNVAVAPDDTIEDLTARVERLLGRLQERPLPLFDPAPAGGYEVTSAMPPAHYEEAVARAVQRIRSGELQKVVLAREVVVRAPAEHRPDAVLGLLREAFGSCYVFAVGRGDSTFVAASPELLIRREGQRASTVALAGSTRRSADPAVDDHLGERLLQSAKDREENAIVARRITRALRPYAVWVTAAPEPSLVRMPNIQHLGAPIRAQLASSVGAVELTGALHPTPAVGGEPTARATEVIPALEGFDRGWYAGPVGWTDATGDGEFCVALRCALLRGHEARAYAGCGIVRDSDPAAELAESEVKLEAMLPALAG